MLGASDESRAKYEARELEDASRSPEAGRRDLPTEPLHSAVEMGDLVMVKSLIGQGAAVNDKNNSGNSPLHYYAAAKGHKAIVKLLIRSLSATLGRSTKRIRCCTLIREQHGAQ